MAAHSQNQAPHKTAVSDYSMLAFSSQRAGKTQMEGQAYLAIAITLDNMQQYIKVGAWCEYRLVVEYTAVS